MWTLRRPANSRGFPSTPREPIKRVDPTSLVTTNRTSSETGGTGRLRGSDRNQTLMRHRGPTLTLSISMLALAMIQLACLRGLISATGCHQLLSPHSLSTGHAAIALATVTATTESEHRIATGITTPARAKTFSGLIRCHGYGYFPHNTPWMIGQMTRAFGADDVAPSARSSENYVL